MNKGMNFLYSTGKTIMTSKNHLFFRWIVFFTVMGMLLIWTQTARAASENQKVYVIPVSGTVEPGMAAYVKRVLEDLKDKDDGIIVFKMDTFGGRVDAALDIVDAISNIPKMKTVSWVEKRAISAGALIALSSGKLFMKKNTIIGDCAPIIQSKEGMEMAGEKIQTVLRARFRALAKKNNYPVVLAESMVSIDMEVYEVVLNGEKQFISKKAYDDLTDDEKKKISSKKTIVAKGQLLTMDDKEAAELGFSQKSLDKIEDLYPVLGITGPEVITIEESWSENLVRFLQPLLPMLMLIGIGAVYLEIKAPGFGIFGITGILCLGLVFFNQYLAGLADYTELLLLLIGILLLGVEVFVLPGFGVAGISALLFIAAGLVLSFQGFVLPDPALPWEGRLLMTNLAQVLGTFLLAFILSLFTIRFILPQISKVIKGPYLSATLSQSHVDSTGKQTVQPGDEGRTLSTLRPSGKVMIGSKKIDAIARGEFIEPGQPVVVDRIESNRVIVKPADAEKQG
jgi:membrane-bound serine protease (ClpP class)